jgi:hypothetical protein
MRGLTQAIRTVRFQQTVLCLLLLGGLAAYFFLAWWLRVKNYILSPENLDALHGAAIQLFLPYIGIAFGGIFGATRLRHREVDPYTFTIAAVSVILWDLLALGNVFLITFEVQAVEDVVRFSENTMPVLSVLVAGSIAYYFGAQSGGADQLPSGPSPSSS